MIDKKLKLFMLFVYLSCELLHILGHTAYGIRHTAYGIYMSNDLVDAHNRI